MKKKMIFILFAICIIFAFISKTNAQVYVEAPRTGKDGKTPIKVLKKNVYVSVWLRIFYNDVDSDEVQIPSKYVTGKYENGQFYITVKGSAINKILDNQQNISESRLEYYIDYLDLNPNKLYWYFSEYSYEHNGCDYILRDSDFYDIRELKLIEITNNLIYDTEYNKEPYISKTDYGVAIIEGNLNNNYKEFPETNCKNDFMNENVILSFDEVKSSIYIIHDEEDDESNNSTTDTTTNNNSNNTNNNINNNSNTNKKEETPVEINNYYVKYFNNKKINYSWTMFDPDGEPMEISVDTTIKTDESKNIDSIINLTNANKNDLKVLSFAHEGSLNGKAKINLYVGDKFKAKTTLYLYYYNSEKNTLENVNSKGEEPYSVNVDKDGYITIELTHCSEYVLTKNKIEVSNSMNEEPLNEETNETNSNKEEKSNTKLFIIIGIISAILIIVAVVTMIIIRKKKKVKKNTEEKINSTEQEETDSTLDKTDN